MVLGDKCNISKKRINSEHLHTKSNDQKLSDTFLEVKGVRKLKGILESKKRVFVKSAVEKGEEYENPSHLMEHTQLC